MAKPNKLTAEYNEWAEEIKPVKRCDERFKEIEAFSDDDFDDCIVYETIKRQLVPLRLHIDFDYENYAKRPKLITQIDSNISLNGSLDEIVEAKNQYDTFCKSPQKSINTIIKFKTISIFKLFIKKGSQKTRQQKAGDFFFIWDCIEWGFKNDYILSRINEYEEDVLQYPSGKKKEESQKMDDKTLAKYKKDILKLYPQKEKNNLTIDLFFRIFHPNIKPPQL